MKQFTINQNSTLPCLEIEPINNGRNDFNKLYMAIQSATVTFTMTNVDTGIKKVANAPCRILSVENSGCDERFKIQYKWQERDTKECGRYKGVFKIKFSDDIKMNGVTFPKGELIVPISEDLIIDIK